MGFAYYGVIKLFHKTLLGFILFDSSTGSLESLTIRLFFNNYFTFV